MEPTFEQKIDRMATDISYMRGKWDEAIPALQTTVKEHGVAIVTLEKSQSNLIGKSGVVGALAGSAVGAFFSWMFAIGK